MTISAFFQLTAPQFVFSSNFAIYFSGNKSQVLSLVCLVQPNLTSFTEKRDQSFSLTCWLLIRDTATISWVLYFLWHCYCGFIYLFFNIMYYLLFVVIPVLLFKFLQHLELEVKPLVLPFLTSKN